MAEQAADGLLLYLIDMAILEANHQKRSQNDNLDGRIAQSPEHKPPRADD